MNQQQISALEIQYNSVAIMDGFYPRKQKKINRNYLEALRDIAGFVPCVLENTFSTRSTMNKGMMFISIRILFLH
jgi:hypothetical protein